MSLKTWFWIHKWTSLICTVFMLLLCVTGLPLIFGHEIDEALGNIPAHRLHQPDLPRKDIDELAATAERVRPGEVVRFLFADPDDEGKWFFSLARGAASTKTTSFLGFDAYSGELVSSYPLGSGFISIMTRLHVDLFAGLLGMLFLGLMGVLLLLSLVSGVFLYAPFGKNVGFAQVRTNKSARTQWLDLHNVLGIVTLVWLFAVGATGVINTLSVPIFAQWQRTQLADMTAPYLTDEGDEIRSSQLSADRAVKSAAAHLPDKRVSFVAYPGTRFASPHHFVAFMAGRTALESKLLTPLLIDAESGDVVDQRELPWYTTLLLLSQPLHFGDYGGMPLKILWALLDVLAIGLLLSGLILWVTKRQDFNTWFTARKRSALS